MNKNLATDCRYCFINESKAHLQQFYNFYDTRKYRYLQSRSNKCDKIWKIGDLANDHYIAITHLLTWLIIERNVLTVKDSRVESPTVEHLFVTKRKDTSLLMQISYTQDEEEDDQEEEDEQDDEEEP
ncbi:hypothetical protein FQR65_LT04962 [Abscondita terminalis]|nr:hypothetical protein FQR65_LT04962 [Abscondita terminalis]